MSASLLKFIAIVSMLVDHVGAVFFPDHVYLRLIGRIAFPIFAFFIAEGVLKSSHPMKYVIRLTVFAFLSEVPFDLAFKGVWLEFGHQNVFFTLAISAMCLITYDKWQIKHGKSLNLPLLLAVLLASLLRTDYGGIGVLMVYFFYVYRGNWTKQTLMVYGINVFLVVMTVIKIGVTWLSISQLFTLISFLLLKAYSGERGPSFKVLFYVFYPAHLLLLALI